MSLALSCVRLALSSVRLVLSRVRLVFNCKIVDIWNDEGYRRDIVGCVRLSFKLRTFSFMSRAFSFS